MHTSESRLDLLKTLGDNTRYAIYLELARSASPLATADIAETLGLHPNTVRPHLERMRDVGLLESRPDSTGAVGRPQKLYLVAEDAPSLGLEPPVFPMMARMLLDVAHAAGVESEITLKAGRSEGRRRARRASASEVVSRSADESDALGPVLEMQAELGFDPTTLRDGDESATVAFTHCPFAELAADNPEVICTLHRGLVEGFLAEEGGATLGSFNDLAHRYPCQMQLDLRNAESAQR
ncbi:MAG TPA: helix-turn-helix domain-containing protein [Microthrixaceae bacterium]|nr:helix-turn-helix domain-containing protein [Microthrixaceae bacterium]